MINWHLLMDRDYLVDGPTILHEAAGTAGALRRTPVTMEGSAGNRAKVRQEPIG